VLTSPLEQVQWVRSGSARKSATLMVFEKLIRCAGLAVGLMVVEKLIRYIGLAVGAHGL